MWPFKKNDSLRALNQRLDLLAEQQMILEDRQLRLDEQYRSLRGYVYAKKGLVGPAGEPPPGDRVLPGGEQAPTQRPAQMTRDELRRSLVTSGRFIPGHAPKHQE